MRTTPLLLLSSIVALPALAQDQAPPLRFYIDGGYGQSNNRFNGSGDKVDGDFENTTLRAGLAYDFMQIGDLGIGAHANFQAANVRIDEIESGFGPQNLGVGLHLKAPRYGMNVAFLYDMGNDAQYNATTMSEGPNTDGLNAIRIGADASTFFSPNLRILGDAAYITTLKGDVTRTFTAGGVTAGTTAETNTGDWFVGQVGVGFRPMPAFEVGAKLAYQYQTAADDNAPSYPGEAAGQKQSNFSVIPFVNLNQPGSPFAFYLEGRSDREYGPIGFTLSGNNTPAGKTGVVVGMRYTMRADQTGM